MLFGKLLAAATESDRNLQKPESCWLQREKATKTIRNPKVPGFSERKRAASQLARW
ncbi:hypothetical protein A2U01_0101566 [Trifolium medium]|uniref:Uncharacterized protein n=1 Tax=Trifolium medium TaxID=97028 RepID=A0A392V002_9FABA|nr:hypothetical protein [Trifolium medium]